MIHIPFVIVFHILRFVWIVLRGIFAALKIFLFIFKLFIALFKFPVTILTKIAGALKRGEKVAGTIKAKISASASESAKLANLDGGGGLIDKLKFSHSNIANPNGSKLSKLMYKAQTKSRLGYKGEDKMGLRLKGHIGEKKIQWNSKGRGDQGITIILVILLFVLIGVLIYSFMGDDEVGGGGGGEWDGSNLNIMGGSIESPPIWVADNHDHVNDVDYTGDTLFNCGRVVKDILANKTNDTLQHLVEFDRVLYKSGNSIVLLDDDISDASYFVYNHGKLAGKFRIGLQKIIKMIGNVQTDKVPRIPMKVYPVKRKKKKDENGVLLHPIEYEESEIYISLTEIQEWRNEHQGVGENDFPSGRILVESDSDVDYRNNLDDREGLLFTQDDITNFTNNADFRIYLGLIYTDGLGVGESLDNEEYGVYDICLNKGQSECGEQDDCLFSESDGRCINMTNPPINGGGGLNDILRLGENQFGECPREASTKNIVFGLYRFINPEISGQSLMKYDEIFSSNILQSESKGLYDFAPESNPVSPYNHLCENPTVSGLAERDIYCALTQMGENCVSYENGEKKQCYDSYPKVVVTNYTSGHRRPIIQVIGIDSERGRITHLAILDDGINSGNQGNQVIDFHIKKHPSDQATDSGIIQLSEVLIDSTETSSQKDAAITALLGRARTQNTNYQFFSEIRHLSNDESECGECYVHDPIVDQVCSGLDETSCRKDVNCHYDGVSCVEVDCSGGIDTPISMEDCIGMSPACKWKNNGFDMGGECVDDLRLRSTEGDGEISTELILDLDGYEGDATVIKSYDCFDQDGVLFDMVEHSEECVDGVNPVRAIYRSRINEAFKLIYEGCDDDYCENNINSCVSSDELESEIEYRCPVDTTNCSGSVVDVDPSLGAPDYSCSDGGCLVRENTGGSRFEIMGPDQRRCATRSPDDCERFDNDIATGNQACELLGDNSTCAINSRSNDPYDCIMGNYNEPSEDGKYYVGDEDRGEIIKSLNCERFKHGNTSRGTFACHTCDGHLENDVVVNQIDDLDTSSASNNPCPDGWKCETNPENGNKQCVDTYMPNRNAYIINDEICFPPFYGTNGSSLRNEDSSIDDNSQSDGTQCAANVDSNHIYKKNGSAMLPHLFPELFGSEGGDQDLRINYAQYMRELDANSHDPSISEMYFNKDEKSGRIYELLERYFNMDAIDYCKNIFTPDTVLINPTMPGQEDESSSYYYPGWIQLKENILNTVTSDGGSGAQSIFSYLNVDSDDTLPQLSGSGDQQSVTNWDNQICMMYRGVDNDLRCSLPVDSGSMTEEICNQIMDYHWNETDQTCRGLDLTSTELTEESLQNYLSTIDHSRCSEMGGTYVTDNTPEEQFQLKKNNRLIPVHNERYCSICRNDDYGTCTNVQCGLNTDSSACNPDGSCNCYGENVGYGPNCSVEPSRIDLENLTVSEIGNKIVHPDNSYSYRGRTTASSELPDGYNMVCKGDYLDPGRTDNTGGNTNYVGKYCTSTINEVCHSRKPIFSSENYSEELKFLNILDMDSFIEKLIESSSSSDDPDTHKYKYWPFYIEGSVEHSINSYNKIMLIRPHLDIPVSPMIKSVSQLLQYATDECLLHTCMDHPFNHARIMHTIALYLFDPYLTKNHYTKTEQPDTSNMGVRIEVAPEWEYNIDGSQYELKLKTTHENFENLPIENKMKYYALAIKMASQFARDEQSYSDGRYSHLQYLLYNLSKTLQLKNGDHKMNFYNAYFKEWSSTATDTGNEEMVNCDCTRPSREDNADIYTFIKNYNPGDVNKISRWGIKPPGMAAIDNEHLYYYGQTCEKYDSKGLDWTTPDPIQGSTAQDENMRCNINTSLSSWNETHDQPRQINDLYSYKEIDGTSKIEDGSIMGDDKSLRNNPFKNPKDYYDGTELSFLSIQSTNQDMQCGDPTTGEVTALCGDKQSIKNEYNHQKSSIGDTWAGIYSSPEYQNSDGLVSHLPDFDTMPEINLIERLRISRSGAECDCSYSQSNRNDGDVKNSSKWGEFCQYTAGSVCNTDNMYDEAPPMSGNYFKFNQSRGRPDNYFDGKRQKQINKEGDYSGLIYSHNYFDGNGNNDHFMTEQQSDTGLGRINFSIDGQSVEIGTTDSDWYQKKINSKIPVIKNPKFKEINQTNMNCSEDGGVECNESLYSLCKCDTGNIENRFTSGAVMSSSSEDNKISCNLIADNCDYSVCQHTSENIATTEFGGFRGGVDTIPGGSWDCDSNPFGFDVTINQGQAMNNRGDMESETDTRNVCFCDDTHYQVGDTPNCNGSCCPDGEISCGWKRDTSTGKNCVEDTSYDHGSSQLGDGTLTAHGRKSKMNAHAVYNNSLNKSGNKSDYDYDPLCDDNCYHTDSHDAIHRYLNEVDSDWDSGNDRDHASPNDNLTLGPGGGLNTNVNFDPGFYWSDFGPLIESSSRTLTDDFYTWLPSHSESIIGHTDSVSGNIHADYKCVPGGELLGPWKERARTENPWMSYYSSSFDDAIEEIFETNKEKYLLGGYRDDTYKDGTLYFDASGWDDNKSAKEQIYNSNIKAYDGTTFINEAGYNRAPTSGRNPMWLLAKGCCSDVLKVERRSQGGVNEVKVSCN
jgi:hypothetical protein